MAAGGLRRGRTDSHLQFTFKDNQKETVFNVLVFVVDSSGRIQPADFIILNVQFQPADMALEYPGTFL